MLTEPIAICILLFIIFEFLCKKCLDIGSEYVFMVKVIVLAKTITYSFAILLLTTLVLYTATWSITPSLYVGLVVAPMFGVYYYKKTAKLFKV